MRKLDHRAKIWAVNMDEQHQARPGSQWLAQRMQAAFR